MTSKTSVAVIGCGYWGKNLVRTFNTLGSLAAISDINAETAATLSEQYGAAVRSIDDVLADAAIDAVVIATPAVSHADLTRRALEAGKHVFVEKPLSLSVDEGQALCGLAQQRRKILMIGHLLRYHPAFLKLAEMAANGDFGRLQYIYSNRLNLGKIRREENILWSFAPHDVSMILALAGSEPTEVFATGSYYLHDTVADVTTTHLRFAGGINAQIFVSWLHPFKEQKLVVTGDKAMAVFDDRLDWDSKLCLYPHKVDWANGTPVPNRADAIAVELKSSEPLLEECAHFLECVAGGMTPRTDGVEGLKVLQVLDAAEKSMASGSVVKLGGDAGNAPAKPYFAHESAVIDKGCEIGDGTKIWHFSHVLSGSQIGAGCTIGQNVMIGPDVHIGARCKIQNNVSIYNGVHLEDGVFCGPSCVFTNVRTPRAEVERKTEFETTHVGRGATIGANATIVCGSRVGAYAFIGAGAVVTGDVAPHALVVGAPARRIGWMSAAGERLGDDLVCPRTGQQYRLTEPDCLEPVSDE